MYVFVYRLKKIYVLDLAVYMYINYRDNAKWYTKLQPSTKYGGKRLN